MLLSLAMNKVDFVKLFIEFGVSINTIVTKDRLSFLYFYAYDHSDDSMLKKFIELESSEVKPWGSIVESISDKERMNKRMDLEEPNTYVTETVCTNTARDDISFF